MERSKEDQSETNLGQQTEGNKSEMESKKEKLRNLERKKRTEGTDRQTERYMD